MIHLVEQLTACSLLLEWSPVFLELLFSLGVHLHVVVQVDHGEDLPCEALGLLAAS